MFVSTHLSSCLKYELCVVNEVLGRERERRRDYELRILIREVPSSPTGEDSRNNCRVRDYVHVFLLALTALDNLIKYIIFKPRKQGLQKEVHARRDCNY